MGIIDKKQLLESYTLCDMFLMPSKGESFGLMAIEAMACSRPVIIFDNTALPSVTFAPDCGLLVENNNADKLREAILKLCDDVNERERRGNLGRKIVEENYNVNDYHKKIISLYESVFDNKLNIDQSKFDNVSKPNTDEIAYLNHLLYVVTNQIFNRAPKMFSIYNQFKKPPKKTEIDYSNYFVREIIEDYNNRLYNFYSLIINKPMYKPSSNQLTNKLKVGIFLLNYDARGLLKIFYSKIIEKKR